MGKAFQLYSKNFKLDRMAADINLEDDQRKVLWYGFDSSVIYNKVTGKQEFVRNSEIGIPKRPRFTFKFR